MPSAKPTVSVRFPEDLLAAIDRIAAEQQRSRNWVVVDLVRKAVDSATDEPAPTYETDYANILSMQDAGTLAVAIRGNLPAYVRVGGNGIVTLSKPDDEAAYAIMPGESLTLHR